MFKKFLIGMSLCILTLGSLTHSSLSMEMSGALSALPERFSNLSSPFEDRRLSGAIPNGKPSAQQETGRAAGSAAVPSRFGDHRETLGPERASKSNSDRREILMKDPVAGGRTGTAWPLPSGHVITSGHVVSGSSEVILIDAHGQEMPASIILHDEANDIVLLEVKEPQRLPPALPLAQFQARLGASVFTIGFPRVDFMGRMPKLSSGVISGEKGLRDAPESFQTTVPIQPGNSGGPLLNMRGEAVGVVRSMVGIRDEASGNLYVLQNTSYALKINDVKVLLNLMPQKDPRITVLPNHSDDLETLASRIKDSILLVISR